jgi:Tetracyclin repressor-like, C-terminal domain
MFDLLLRHRHIALLMLEEVPSGPFALRLRQEFRPLLIANGFSKVEATLAYATVARFVLGLGVQLSADSPASGGGQPAAIDSDAGAVGSVSLEQEFAYGLHLLVVGLRVQQASTT